MTELTTISRSILRPETIPYAGRSDITTDIIVGIALLGFGLVRVGLFFVPLWLPPTTEAFVGHSSGNPVSDFQFYLWSDAFGLAFALAFYIFTKRYLDRIHIPYFAKSDGEKYYFWLFAFTMAYSLLLTLVDPTFWYLGPMVAGATSLVVVGRRHREIRKTITAALDARGKARTRVVQIDGTKWLDTYVLEVQKLSGRNFQGLLVLGLGLGSVLLIPVMVTHLAFLFQPPASGTYFRGLYVGINVTCSVQFTLIYMTILMSRYLSIIKSVADRLDRLEARTLPSQ